MEKKSVLFICTGNSVRSQMAEALLRHFGGDQFEVFSAGFTPAGIHRFTKQVLSEIGIRVDDQFSKHVDTYLDRSFDYVIVLCEVAALSCPPFAGNAERINWFIDDPIRVFGSEERRLMAFKITRNILKERIMKFIKEKGAPQPD
ncbi:MAG: arsenate reductase ArsC [Candidatus Marinimicrobia bacterium]|jgi:arsenate reductase|nr:arsenate reductase ArsC [Candidatus Neomarinimicrobiota bacterium]MDD5062060.1 arsenate reductase ArsC [Candidatus Neomarinimicrobiota bacterium]MDD5231452.1 arsenate reductase ArsC [Candidatus Neomarinimicrobiota bacterium]MDD5539733.1 arsenate reductase ArsC [Candidatus Neomarinimicrobiota bacterium]